MTVSHREIKIISERFVPLPKKLKIGIIMSKRTNKKLSDLCELEYETMGGIADGTSFFDFSMINSFADLKDILFNPFLDEWDQNINFDEMDFMRYYSAYMEYILVKFPKPQCDFEAYFGIVVSQFDERSYFLLAKHGKITQIIKATSDHKEYLEEYSGEIDIDAFRKYILDNYYPHPPLSEAEVEAIFQEGESFHLDNQYDKAVTCFKKATLYGHLESLVKLGECYMAGYGVEMNSKLGTELLMKAGVRGSADAYYILGYYSMHGIGDVEQDERRAKKLLKKYSDLCNKDASLLLTCYFGWDN